MIDGAVWLLLGVGVLLVGLVCLDIFLTVLYPSVESPLSNRFQQLIWWALRSVDRVVNRSNHQGRWLEPGLPLMVAGLIILWLVLLCTGFACLYLPWIHDPEVFAIDNRLQRPWLDALYFSGVTLATLGYGDVLPLTTPIRILAVAEAILGAITISAGVAYVLAVYPALAQQRTIARALNAEVAGQADALPMLRRYLASDGNWHPDLFVQLRDLGLALLDISESHDTHSVLYYAHPPQVQHSFVRVLIIAQSLVASLRYSLSVDTLPDTVQHPHVLLLEQSLHYSLHRLSRSIHIPDAKHAFDDDERQHVAIEHRERCQKLEQLGLASVRTRSTGGVPVLVQSDAEKVLADSGSVHTPANTVEFNGHTDAADPALDLVSSSPQEAYVTFRQQTDPQIAAYAAACGYDLAQARADFATTWWTGGR